MSPLRATLAGMRGRCPRCGEGALFSGFLSLAPACSVCALDFGEADAGDGPAVFVVLIVGALVVPVALVIELSGAPIWANLLIVTALGLGLILALLRPVKAVLVALQFVHGAREGRLDER